MTKTKNDFVIAIGNGRMTLLVDNHINMELDVFHTSIHNLTFMPAEVSTRVCHILRGGHIIAIVDTQCKIRVDDKDTYSPAGYIIVDHPIISTDGERILITARDYMETED